MDSIEKYYKGDELAEASPIIDEAKKHVAPFIKDLMSAIKDADDQTIHPLDWVVLSEEKEEYVGNHPLIKIAYKLKAPGRVVAVQSTMLTAQQARALSAYTKTNILKFSECQIHVIFFKEQEKPFVFWAPFLRKVEARPQSAIEVS